MLERRNILESYLYPPPTVLPQTTGTDLSVVSQEKHEYELKFLAPSG